MGYVRPQIRILRKISSLEPAGNVPNPVSRPENPEIYFLISFLLISSWGYKVLVVSLTPSTAPNYPLNLPKFVQTPSKTPPK